MSFWIFLDTVTPHFWKFFREGPLFLDVWGPPTKIPWQNLGLKVWPRSTSRFFSLNQPLGPTTKPVVGYVALLGARIF